MIYPTCSLTHSRWAVRRRWIPALLVVTALTGPPLASEPAPTGASVLDAYVEATGGAKAYGKLQNRVTEAVFEVPAAGMKMEVTIYHARPARNYTLIESQEMGTIEKGTDGDVVWELSAMTGPQIKQGQERTDFLRETVFDRLARWRELYETVEYVGDDDVQGRSCRKLEVTPKDGGPQTWWFDIETGLLVKVRVVVENALGSIPLETYLDDYRRVDGILLPHTALVDAMGQRRVMTTTKVRHNVDLPASRFDPPSEVLALLKQADATQDGGTKAE